MKLEDYIIDNYPEHTRLYGDGLRSLNLKKFDEFKGHDVDIIDEIKTIEKNGIRQADIRLALIELKYLPMAKNTNKLIEVYDITLLEDKVVKMHININGVNL